MLLSRGVSPASSRFSGGRSFFNKYPLQGVKSKDFSDFCKAVDIVGNKARARGPCKTQGLAHLSKEGLDQIRIIKNRMNTNRKE
jgi:hypothetical protein